MRCTASVTDGAVTRWLPALLLLLRCLGTPVAAAYNYTYALNQLVEGTMLQNASSTRGAMWLNVRGFEPSAVPFIQQNLGVHSLDAYDELRQVAGLAMMAAQYKLYGDLIYLYSLFGMNAAFGASSVEGAAMKEVLWRAATGCASLQCDGRDAVTIPTHLLSLYASTSTCPSLSRVYEEFTASWANATTRLRIMRTLDEEPESSSPTTNSTITPQAASIVTCSGLVTLLKDGRMSPKYGGPRSVCYSSCCIKWTGNGVFHWADILPTIQTFCLNRAVANTRTMATSSSGSTDAATSSASSDGISSSSSSPSSGSDSSDNVLLKKVDCKLPALGLDGLPFEICVGDSASSCR